MTKHTPGPWKCETMRGSVFGDNMEGREGDISYLITNGKYVRVAETDNKANARLIAAAVDLLAACETLLTYSRDFQDGKRDGSTMGMISLAMDRAREAVKKAKGE